MTFVVGLTGGLGAGKSTVANLFAQYDVPILDADLIAREVVLPGTPSYEKILERYGATILDEKKHLNRKKLGNLIFNDLEERLWLEQLLHPEIHDEIKKRLETITAPYCLLVIPLLAENYHKYQDILDFVITVEVPPEIQLARVKQRDGLAHDLIEKILQTQANCDERVAIADVVINNTSDTKHLEKEVTQLHRQFLGLSG